MITRRLQDIRDELATMAEKESLKVWRMARRAKAHGCSNELVDEIREEGWQLHSNYKSYPERLLGYNAKHDLKYAFCGERIRHTYLVINEDGDVIRTERR